jgi:hypothetical protein
MHLSLSYGSSGLTFCVPEFVVFVFQICQNIPNLELRGRGAADGVSFCSSYHRCI